MQNKKVALICGNGGVGKAMAAKFIAENYTVIILSKNKEDYLGNHFFQCDISDAPLVSRVVDQIVQEFGVIDVLVIAVASAIQRINFLDLDDKQVAEDFNIVIRGVFNILKYVGLKMKKQKSGSIIAITSAVTEQNHAAVKMGAYMPAKYALKGMLRQAHYELVQYGVRVNAIAPGFMRTKLNSDIPTRLDDFLVEKNPMKHIVVPEEVAEVAFFLASDQSRYLSGVSIPVTAGETSNL